MLNDSIKTATAFSPATCANVVVGFDILGLAIAGVGDEVSLTRRSDNQLIIENIESADAIPQDPQKNVVTAVIAQLCQDLQINTGFNIRLKKGIPLSSGMGGSAASAVAALVALNAFLAKPLSLAQLANYALQGEAFCSGQPHPDNVVPALYGGITLITDTRQMNVVPLPIPPIICVLVHPHLQLSTRESRKVLAPTISLHTYVAQTAYLAGFISALYQQDLTLLQNSLQDVVIEPQRAALIPGFALVKQAALAAGALGMSLSGSGPSLLALAANQEQAQNIGVAMQQAFQQQGIASELYLSPISQKGAQVVL